MSKYETPPRDSVIIVVSHRRTSHASLVRIMVVSKSGFRELVEKATSQLIPSGHEDVFVYFEISDSIRAKSVAPQFAANELRLRLTHANPNVQILALSVR